MNALQNNTQFTCQSKITDRIGDIAGLVGLTCVRAARNGAEREIIAQNCANADGKKERCTGQQSCCPVKN